MLHANRLVGFYIKIKEIYLDIAKSSEARFDA